MTPALFKTASGLSPELFSTAVFHHTIGLLAFAMAALAIIKGCAWIGAKFGNLRNYMLALFLLWPLAYLGGIALYLAIYKPFG